MQVEYINPFIRAAANVFDTMLGCTIEREGLALKEHFAPTHEVSAVIGLSGKATGAVVLSLSREVAFKAVEILLDTEVSEINADVVDAVGELTNMVAGNAKAALEQFEMSLGLPSVVTGRSHTISFPSKVTPLCVSFKTPWGPLSLEVGLKVNGC